MGSLFSPKQPAPPPPAPPTYVRDEVNGVEQMPQTNADGSVTYITRAIALTPAQAAERAEIDKIVQDSLTEISRLSRTDYAPDEATNKVLEQWQQRQTALLEKQTQSRTQTEEERLARLGLADSTAAQSVRRERALDEQEARQTLGLQRDELGNQIRNTKLGLQQNLYGLASTQKDASAARIARAATSGMNEAVALNVQRQSSILDYYQKNQSAGQSSIFSSFGSSSLGGSGGGGTRKEQVGGTIGGYIGQAVGGPTGRVAGTMIGSWIGSKV